MLANDLGLSLQLLLYSLNLVLEEVTLCTLQAELLSELYRTVVKVRRRYPARLEMSGPISSSGSNSGLLRIIAIILLGLHLRKENRLLVRITRNLVGLLSFDCLQSIFSLGNHIFLGSSLAQIFNRLLVTVDCLFGLFSQHNLRSVDRLDNRHELALMRSHQ